MKYYLVLNLKRQTSGPIATPEKGLEEMQKSKALKGTFEVIGECDAAGNLLLGIANNNFTKTTKQVATPSKSKPNKAEALFVTATRSEDAPDIDDVDVDSGTNKVKTNNDNNGKARSQQASGKKGSASKAKA